MAHLKKSKKLKNFLKMRYDQFEKNKKPENVLALRPF